MQTRRAVVTTLAGAFVLVGGGVVALSEDNAAPPVKLIPGKPPILDYGDGAQVPCSKDAFFTLWESSTFWLTFGFGISGSTDQAKTRATRQASSVMRYLLLTLVFAPDRLTKSDGNGWRNKDPKSPNFVLGELDLPGSPTKPMTDAFLGTGNIEISPFWTWADTAGGAAPGPTRGLGSSTDNRSSMPTDMRRASAHAFCEYLVLKKDLSLDDVRKRARILQP